MRVLLINTRKAEPIRRLERMAGVELVVITEPWNTFLYPTDTEVYTAEDLTDFRSMRSIMMAAMKSGRIDHVVTPAERAVQVGGYLRSFFGIPGIGYELANRFTNKHVMKRELTAHGFDVAGHRVVHSVDSIPDAARQVGWPVVVKPVLGTGAYHTFRIDSEAAFAKFHAGKSASTLTRLDVPLLVEEFIEMEAEYHVDAVVQGGDVVFAGASKYFMPLLDALEDFTGSYFLPTADPDGKALLDIHQGVVEAFGLRDGVTHLEVFKRADRFIVSEIACRPGGGGIGRAAQLQYGIDLWHAFFELSLGRRVSPESARQVRRDDIVANCDLPLRPGTVSRISPLTDVLATPGVIEAELNHTVGDVIASPYFDSSAAAGRAYLAADTSQGVREAVSDLSRRFVFDVTAPEGDRTGQI